MKILYLIYFDPNGRGGNVAHARGFLKGLLHHGCQVTVLGPGWRGWNEGAHEALVTHNVAQWRRSGLHTLSYTLALLPMLIWQLLVNRPDVIYARYFNFLFPVGWLARVFRIPLISEHNADIQAEHRIHGRGRLSRWFHDWAECSVLRSVRGAIVVTRSMLESWQRRHSLSGVAVEVVGNGVEDDVYYPRDKVACRVRLGLSGDSPLICYLGSFVQAQGIRFLIEALTVVRQSHRDVRAVLVGGNLSQIQDLEYVLEAEGLTDVVSVIPEVEPSLAAIHIGAADICVAPYDRSVLLHAQSCEFGAAMKGDPLKIYAYLACARPVVASYFREAGARLEQLQAGIAVPPENPDALAEAICTLLQSPLLSAEMGRNGRAFVEQEATWRVVAKKTLTFMRHCGIPTER